MDSDLKQQLIDVLEKGELLCNFMQTQGINHVDIMSAFASRSRHIDILELAIEFEQLAEELQDA